LPSRARDLSLGLTLPLAILTVDTELASVFGARKRSSIAMSELGLGTSSWRVMLQFLRMSVSPPWHSLFEGQGLCNCCRQHCAAATPPQSHLQSTVSSRFTQLLGAASFSIRITCRISTGLVTHAALWTCSLHKQSPASTTTNRPVTWSLHSND